MLLDNSREIRLWRCRNGHEHRARVSARAGNTRYRAQGCPCKDCFSEERFNVTETEFNDLFDRSSRNLGFDPSALPIGHRIFFRCKENRKHRSYITITELEEKGCTACRKAGSRVFLSDARFEPLARQFVNAVRHPDWTPKNILAGSAVVCTWQCPAHEEHIYRKAVSRRTVDGQGCPSCAGKRASVTNSLAGLHAGGRSSFTGGSRVGGGSSGTGGGSVQAQNRPDETTRSLVPPAAGSLNFLNQKYVM
jgi:hypothetical protein